MFHKLTRVLTCLLINKKDFAQSNVWITTPLLLKTSLLIKILRDHHANLWNIWARIAGLFWVWIGVDAISYLILDLKPGTMKKYKNVALSVCLIYCSLYAVLVCAETQYVSDQLEVTLRRGPTLSHAVLRMLKSGAAVESSGSWCSERAYASENE